MKPTKSPSRHFTPLRYPGGKGKLSAFIEAIVKDNGLSDGHYVEPYAGGAAVALELLLTERVARISLNDLSKDIFSFWYSVLNHTEDLCTMIAETPITLGSWDEQKRIHKSKCDEGLALGFATFFLNRTNRSGILNAGVIGGRSQTGDWKIDARYNRTELVRRVEAIATRRQRISITSIDAVEFLQDIGGSWGNRTLVYLDPPYFVKGRDLYFHHYRAADHLKVRDAVRNLDAARWVVSYDNAPEIRSIYSGFPAIEYDIGYSAREHSTGSEVMFFSEGLLVPPVCSAMKETARTSCLRAAA